MLRPALRAATHACSSTSGSGSHQGSCKLNGWSLWLHTRPEAHGDRKAVHRASRSTAIEYLTAVLYCERPYAVLVNTTMQGMLKSRAVW